MTMAASLSPSEGLALAGGVIQTAAIDLADSEVESVAALTLAIHIQRAEIGSALSIGGAGAFAVCAVCKP